MNYLTLKQLGLRRLGGRDIIRAGDLQWCNKTIRFDSINDLRLLVETTSDSHWVGQQVCTEEVQSYSNFFFRKISDAPNTPTP